MIFRQHWRHSLVASYALVTRTGNNQRRTIRRTRWPCRTSWSGASSARVAPRSPRSVRSPAPWSESATARRGRVVPQIVRSPSPGIRTLWHWHSISSAWGEYTVAEEHIYHSSLSDILNRKRKKKKMKMKKKKKRWRTLNVLFVLLTMQIFFERLCERGEYLGNIHSSLG